MQKYSIPKRTCIGKRDPEQPDFMFPNEKFLKFFPRELLPSEKDGRVRSGCLHVGAFLVIRNIISDYKLDEMIARIIGKDAGLFLDMAAYSIITEENAGQHYPDYAYNHALFTDDMNLCYTRAGMVPRRHSAQVNPISVPDVKGYIQTNPLMQKSSLDLWPRSSGAGSIPS